MTVGRRWLRFAVVAALFLWSCSGTAETAGGHWSGASAADGFRVHRSYTGHSRHAIVLGIVEVDLDAGCVWLSGPRGIRYPVVWPVGTSARSDPFRITVPSDHFGIPVGKGQVVRPGDRVKGGGGYTSAGSTTRHLGLEPFPTECVHVGKAAVFNSDSPIEVTAGVGLELVETLAYRFSLPDQIGLDLIAVNPDAPSVAVIDFGSGTVHRYEPGQYHGPTESIDGASGGGSSVHLWSEGTIYSYGRLTSEPLVYQPDPLRQTPAAASTLVVLPAPDRKHTWLVQPGAGNEPTLVELVSLVGRRVTRRMSTGLEGLWQPVGVTVEGLVLVTDDSQPTTRLVSTDGTIRTEVAGTALSVGWNGAAVLRPDGSLIVTDAHLVNPNQVAKPGTGEWMPVGGPVASTNSPPAVTAADQFLVMLAPDPEEGPLDSGTLVMVDPAGNATPIFELTQLPHLASWSSGEDWVLVVEESSVTLINIEDGTIEPLGAIVPDSHWVLSAG